MITELKWWDEQPEVHWRAHGIPVVRRLPGAARSVVALRDGSGLAVVLHAPKGVLDAVWILNADGGERAQVTAPSASPEATYLDQIYYVLEELTLFVNVRGYDWAHVLDERSGRVLRSYETR